MSMKSTRLQIVIDENTLFDLKNYAQENGFNYGDLVRQLIHKEFYQSQSLAKKPKHDKKK
jgi:predicted DNA binding CopG/RHH family protein